MFLRKFVKYLPDVKCCLFKTNCCKIYCAPFWYDSTKAAVKNLKVAYNNSLRKLPGLPSHNSASGMFVNLIVPSFGELLRKYVYSFRNRLESSETSIIRGIYLSQFLLQSGIWFGDVIFCRRTYTIILCIILYFYFFIVFLILIYMIYAKLAQFLYGLRFRNKHIMNEIYM